VPKTCPHTLAGDDNCSKTGERLEITYAAPFIPLLCDPDRSSIASNPCLSVPAAIAQQHLSVLTSVNCTVTAMWTRSTAVTSAKHDARMQLCISDSVLPRANRRIQGPVTLCTSTAPLSTHNTASAPTSCKVVFDKVMPNSHEYGYPSPSGLCTAMAQSQSPVLDVNAPSIICDALDNTNSSLSKKGHLSDCLAYCNCPSPGGQLSVLPEKRTPGPYQTTSVTPTAGVTGLDIQNSSTSGSSA
jgi:hypothetical protein